MDKDYYTVKEVAKILNMVEQTIRNYIYFGTIKSEKLMNSRVISREELEKQIELRANGPRGQQNE